jgi:hypothetical protein
MVEMRRGFRSRESKTRPTISTRWPFGLMSVNRDLQ